MGGRKVSTAHRVSWELHNGPIPEGLHVLHRCDNPECTNPDHLFLGSNADNVADRQAKGRYRGGGSFLTGRRKPGEVSERTRYRRARFEREQGKTPYAQC